MKYAQRRCIIGLNYLASPKTKNAIPRASGYCFGLEKQTLLDYHCTQSIYLQSPGYIKKETNSNTYHTARIQFSKDHVSASSPH